jgi:hypothetical protein
MVKRRRKRGGMSTGEQFAEALGIGRNQAYEALAKGKVKGAVRFGRRWLIPDAVIARILAGEAEQPEAGA